ncbi:fatty acyl-CoA reductase 1-like isoform X2 [Triticum dicoccoides]|uniref:fatty acyl-CoA reductase 1-like isoform X2 n=1 Tax=Triticum dicoccoides TaxID=85692 RepID=UPI00188F9D60|nr:fatty acyl-CoA reductase 1-like isoform X2 [Triticum dicoccoides]
MDAAAVIGCFRDRSILITGSTGFLGKMLVEKILRVQPDVRKLYLLVRAPDAASAEHRVLTEVVATKLFDVLRSKHGADFNSFIKNKISPLPGDITKETCALRNSMVEQISKDIHVIVSVAATTSFYERYDVALASNTLGVAHVCDLAKKCANLKMLLHVSTAFVAGEQEGLLLEKPFDVGKALKKDYNLDIQSEIKLVESVKSKLRIQFSNDKIEKRKMKELGLKRARHFGWPNVYSLTKAMGEMLLGTLGRDLPAVIVRPSIISSTFQEPMPGWTEGTRTMDMLYVAYNDQKLPCFIADRTVIVDVTLHVMSVFGHSLSQHYNKLKRGYNFLILVAKLYAPYAFFKGCFDDTNMRNLWAITSTDQLKDGSTFDCDPACIDWGSYLINTHIPAALTYARNNN